MIRWPDNTEDKWYYAAMQEATNSHDYEHLEMDVTEDWTELLISFSAQWPEMSEKLTGRFTSSLRNRAAMAANSSDLPAPGSGYRHAHHAGSHPAGSRPGHRHPSG